MRTEKEIRERIAQIERDSAHVLTGSTATVFINAPRALCQLEAEVKLKALKWVIGEVYHSRLVGVDT